MKKKLLSLAVCGLAVAGLAACGNNGSNSNVDYGDVSTKITVWAAEGEIPVINQIIEEYNAAQTEASSKFNVEIVQVSEADAGTTLAKDPTVEGAPALFLAADDHLYNLVSKDIVLEIKGDYKARIDENIDETTISASTFNDKLYGFPVTADNGYFLWYDKSALSDVSSLEGILETAKSLGKTVLMDIPNGWYANAFFTTPDVCGVNSLQWSSDADGKISYTVNWDNETGVAAVDAAKDLLMPYYADGTLKIGGNDVILGGFQDGSMIAAVSGTWMEADLKKAIGDNLAADKLPTFNVNGKDCQLGSFTGTKTYCINKTRPAAEQRVAANLADLLTNYDSQLTRYQVRQSIPCNVEALNAPEFTENATLGSVALAKQNEFAAIQSKSVEGRYWDIGKAIGQYIIDGVLGEATSTADLLKISCDQLRAKQ